MMQKRKKLEELLDVYAKEDIILAFSGGVDSTVLLKAACEKAKKHHRNVYAYTIHTVLHPMEELELTERMAREMGAIHRVVQVDELREAGIQNNPENRCYLCKKCMFTKVKHEAERLGITTILDGTNADDTKEYRPGIAALAELGIKSPLLIAGFSKAEVRALAADYHLEVSNRPAAPCMATRFPYGTTLNSDEMHKVEQMETKIRQLGFYNVRTRIHELLVRIEVDRKDIPCLLEKKEEVIRLAKSLGYDYVTVDLEGFRSGSQDIHVTK